MVGLAVVSAPWTHARVPRVVHISEASDLKKEDDSDKSLEQLSLSFEEHEVYEKNGVFPLRKKKSP